MKLQKLGGYAAIIYACLFLISAFLGMRAQRIGNLDDPINAMATISSSPNGFYFNYNLQLVIYILFLIVIIALSERMKAHAPIITLAAVIAASVSTAAGVFMALANTTAIELIVPTNDVSAYTAFHAITQSLWHFIGQSLGWVGLLIGIAVLKTNAFQKTPAWLFILMGIFWVLRLPILIKLNIIGIVPFLLLFVGTFWFGIAMIRQKQEI